MSVLTNVHTDVRLDAHPDVPDVRTDVHPDVHTDVHPDIRADVLDALRTSVRMSLYRRPYGRPDLFWFGRPYARPCQRSTDVLTDVHTDDRTDELDVRTDVITDVRTDFPLKDFAEEVFTDVHPRRPDLGGMYETGSDLFLPRASSLFTLLLRPSARLPASRPRRSRGRWLREAPRRQSPWRPRVLLKPSLRITHLEAKRARRVSRRPRVKF